MGRCFLGQSYKFGCEKAAAGEHESQEWEGSGCRLEFKGFIPKNAPLPSLGWSSH